MNIDRRQYPELDLLLWDYLPTELTPERALDTYETRWLFVDQNALTEAELSLIEQLTTQYGKGVFLAA